MNLEVRARAWQEVPRYIGYDRFLRTHLPQGPDSALIARCHAAMLECVRFRDGQRCMSRIERRGSHAFVCALEASAKRQRKALGNLVRDAAHLSAKTDCGLTWKGDALIHLIDDFDIEGLPEIVCLARIYARDVRDRFHAEVPVALRDRANVAGEAGDCDFGLGVHAARNALHRCEEVAAKAAAPPRAARKEALLELEAAEEALQEAEREARARLEACRYLCPRCLHDIYVLAQLVLLLIGEGDNPHRQRLAAGDFSRTLANAVRCAVGVDLVDPVRTPFP